MAKLWLLDFNYCQNNKAHWKNLRAFLKLLDTITGYLLFLFIYLFIYLFIFSVNKFLLTTVNKTFYNLSLLEFSQKRCSADVLLIFRDISVRGCDFNKVAKWFCWYRASALLFSCRFASCLQSIFLGEHLWRTASKNKENFIHDF